MPTLSKQIRAALFVVAIVIVAVLGGVVAQKGRIEACLAAGSSREGCIETYQDWGQLTTQIMLAVGVLGPIALGYVYADELHHHLRAYIRPARSHRELRMLRGSAALSTAGVILFVVGALVMAATSASALHDFFTKAAVAGGSLFGAGVTVFVVAQILIRKEEGNEH